MPVDLYGSAEAEEFNLLQDIQRGIPDHDEYIDYGSIFGTDKPIYIGVAPPGTSTSSNLWSIQKFTWIIATNGSIVPSLIQTRVGEWDQRTTLF